MNELLRKQVEINLDYSSRMMLNCSNPKRRNEVLKYIEMARQVLQEDEDAVSFDGWYTTVAMAWEVMKANLEDPEFKLDFEN